MSFRLLLNQQEKYRQRQQNLMRQELLYRLMGQECGVALAPDLRFGMQAPFKKWTRVTMPSKLEGYIWRQQTISLRDPNDLLSIQTITETESVNGKTFTSTFDGATREVINTSPLGRQSKSEIDEKGRPVSLTISGLTPTQLTYQPDGALSLIAQGTRETLFSYNSQGFLTSIRNPLGQSTGFQYDSAGRVRQKTLADGRSIIFNYDLNGNLISLAPPGRPLHDFVYTPLDFVESYIPPLLGQFSDVTQYAYNLDKQLINITKPNGEQVNFVYDEIKRRLNSISTPQGSITMSYHPTSGKLKSITRPEGNSISYSYDGALLTQTTWNGSVAGTLYYSYDKNFRVVSQWLGNQGDYFVYDNDGLLTNAGALTLSRNAQNGLITATSLASVSDSYSHNTYGEISGYSSQYNGSSLYSFDINRDNLGRITSKTETVSGEVRAHTYLYDTAGRLTQATRNGAVTSYSYDSNGNRISKSTVLSTLPSTFDEQDRLLSAGDLTFGYSRNGDLERKTDTATNQVTTYFYDLFGNLRSVSLPTGSNIEYIVDGQNRRIGKKINGILRQGLLYKGQYAIVAELSGTGATVSRFIYGSKSHVPDSMVKNGVIYRILSDSLGSRRLIVNTSTGQIAQQIDYDEFGVVTLDTNPGFQPFGFAGGLYDADTKLVRFGARDYDPEVGRWTSRDPILFAGKQTNLYGYSFNDPVNFIDPSGRFGVPGATVGFISGAIGGYATGGFWGGVVGSVVGAGVGFANPWGSSTAGAFAGGVVSSLAGQVLGNAINQQPLLSIDPSLAVASGFGGSTAALGARAAGAAGISNVAVESGIATVSDLLFNIPANNLSPGPYDFGKMCK